MDRPELREKIADRIWGLNNTSRECLFKADLIQALFDAEIESIFEEINSLIPDHKYDYWIDEVGNQQKKHGFGYCARCEFEALKSRILGGK